MTPARWWSLLLVLLVFCLGALVFGFVHYKDDSRDQVWQFDLGMMMFVAGLIALLVTVIGAVLWQTLSNRRRDNA